MQANVFAPSDTHPELQAFEPVKMSDALLVHCATFAAQHHVNAVISKPWSFVGDLTYLQPKCLLILRLAFPIKGRP